MSATIKNFLVGIGMQYDERGGKDALAGIEGIGKKALQVGALVGGAFGGKALTFGFAEANDELGKFTKLFGVGIGEVSAFGRALEHENGTIEDMLNNVRAISQIRSDMLKGDFSVYENLIKSGLSQQEVDDIFSTDNAIESFKKISDAYKRLSEDQRRNVSGVFGFSEPTQRFLSKGSGGMQAAADAEAKLRPTTENMARVSAEFNNEVNNLGNSLGSLADIVSEKLLPKLSKLVNATTDWMEKHKDEIGGYVETAQELPEKGGDAFDLAAVMAGSSAAAAYFLGLSAAAPAALLAGTSWASYQIGSMSYDKMGSTEGFKTAADFIFESIESMLDPSNFKTPLLIYGAYEMGDIQTDRPNYVTKQPIEVNVNLDGQVIQRQIEMHNEKMFDMATESSMGKK